MRKISRLATHVFWRPPMPVKLHSKPLRRKASQARSRQKVALIIEASAQVLTVHGYRRSTTNMIAERAGVSVGTIYQYFNNKDEIFVALLESEGSKYLSALKDASLGLEMPLDQAIRVLIEVGFQNRALLAGVQQVTMNVPFSVYRSSMRELRLGLSEFVRSFLVQRHEFVDCTALEEMSYVIAFLCLHLSTQDDLPFDQSGLEAVLARSSLILARAALVDSGKTLLQE